MTTFSAVRRGRPTKGPDTQTTPVNVRMSDAAYDAAYRRAIAERSTVPELVRRAVAQYLSRPTDDDRDDD